MSVGNNGVGGGDRDSGVLTGPQDHANPDKLLSQSIKIHNENSR